MTSSASGDELDRHLDAVLVGGREEVEVRLVEYSDTWAQRFEAERRRIEALLGSTARAVEHVGSTAVPGLAAKPIVDIMVTVDDPDDERGYVARLEQAGYALRVREPGHRMFRTPERDVHLHVWPADSEDERRHLLFRDWLQSHPSDRSEYERVKRELAGHWEDVNHYARAKSAVIGRIMERARREGAGPARAEGDERR
jgi:GrpB-like predicted nucleotidyltransferase (UPF0157 family)